MSLHIKYIEDDTFKFVSPALNVTFQELEAIIKYPKHAFQEICSVDNHYPIVRKLFRLYNWFYLGLPYESYSNLTECKTDYCPLNRLQYPERRKNCENFILDRMQSSSPLHVLSVYPGGLFSEMILALRIMSKMLAEGKNRLFHLSLYTAQRSGNGNEKKMTQFVEFMASASFLFNVDMKIECLQDTKTLNTNTLIFATDPGLEYFEIRNAANELLQMIDQVGKDQAVFAANTTTLLSDADIKAFNQSLREADLREEELNRQSGIMSFMTFDSSDHWYEILKFWDRNLETWIEFCPTKHKMFYIVDGNKAHVLNHDYEPSLYRAEEDKEKLLGMKLMHRKNVLEALKN